jgi:hypothetical protein
MFVAFPFTSWTSHVRDLTNGQTKIDIDHVESVGRHVRRIRFVWVLHNRDTAACLDGEKTGRPVVATASQHYTHNFFAMLAGGTAKQNIRRRAMTIRSDQESAEHAGRKSLGVRPLNERV